MARERMASRKKKERKNVLNGVAHIRSTFNNTIVTITDASGNALNDILLDLLANLSGGFDHDVFVSRLFLGACNGFARALAGACIGTGTLTTYRQAAAMTQTAIAAQVHQALDVHGDFRAQVSFHLVMHIDDLPDGVDLAFGKIIAFGIPIDVGLSKNLLGSGATDTIDIGQGDLYPFVLGQVNPGNTCQCEFLLLALSLLVPWIFTDNADRPVTAYDPALPTNSLDRCSHFHAIISSSASHKKDALGF